MAIRRRKPENIRPTSPRATRGSRPETSEPPRPLWRAVGRRAVLSLAGSTGAATVTILEWYLRLR